MGRTGSSSKRKSSKKKRDKISSQKKKNWRKESKKRRRVNDSVSSHSDDDSLSAKHTSSSTSKSNHRRRRNRNKKLRRDYSVSSDSDDLSIRSDSDSLSTYDSGFKHRRARRSRVGLKSKSKRARRRSASPNVDADAHTVRKRKTLGRDSVVKPRKKSSKKKSKRHLSSSSSSDSESCSTCQSTSSSSSADRKRRRKKGILNDETEKLRGGESYKPRKKRKLRSPSCSSCRKDSDHSFSVSDRDGVLAPVTHSNVALAPVSNSRRLRSVITIADQPRDEGEDIWEKDPHKEEIVYNHDDYPSPRSLNSNEGGSKMDSDGQSYVASNKRICVENVLDENATELRISGIDEGDKDKACNLQSDRAHMKNFKAKEIDESAPVAALGGGDLESILRQKALENLRKFRGGIHSGPRSSGPRINNESDLNGSSIGRVDNVPNKSTKQGDSNLQEINQTSGPFLKRDFPLSEVKKLPDEEHIENPGITEQTIVHPADKIAILEGPEEEKCTTWPAVLSKTLSTSETNPGAGTINACSLSNKEPASSERPISGEHSLEHKKDETKDGSQFEQKTMSVMRGGEMVQVSYKVYIPKKTPALARRQLRRNWE
ncbi:suppressor protein SRP40 isoform X2 [Sesamum indicum]|uniref:Suppressor protein SRP40 isoform X2 n=1 Tax=Sesamum indicum TaxID=4182 RepID=A0A6I9TCT0_SESIN|nr:suppressor protein SRP40 isoform X2 [Sesamum indicum]